MEMKFEEFTYTRPDLGEVTARFEKALEKFRNAGSLEEQNAAM